MPLNWSRTLLKGGWRVRYFAPGVEVAFCGHATIALGAVLAMRLGDARYALQLNAARISVKGRRDGALRQAALRLFTLHGGDLDPRIPPAIANAGIDHPVLALRSRERLAAMHYQLEVGRALMTAEGIGTIDLIHAETPRLIHSRNAFAIGGVLEDPATGAAAAALGGYLRNIGWPHAGAIEIVQGEDMGMRSRLHVGITPERWASVRVSGCAHVMG